MIIDSLHTCFGLLAYQQLCSIDHKNKSLEEMKRHLTQLCCWALLNSRRFLLTTLQQQHNHLPQVYCPGIDISTVRQVSTGQVTQRNAWMSMQVTACVCKFVSPYKGMCMRVCVAFRGVSIHSMPVNVHARMPATRNR